MKRIVLLLLMLAMALPAFADYEKPGQGVKVQPARAVWNTGYFQEAIVRAGLKELGYNVKKPKELQVALFYQTVALGDVDYWMNGWFPTHNDELKGDKYGDRIAKVGYVIKAGAMQGFMVSKKEVDTFGITSLADFSRPEVKEAFDKNGDGKADLVSCESGWTCDRQVRAMMKAYELEDDINLITSGYTVAIADTLANYRTGKPAFFYNWAPNWTVFVMKPGEDVMWVNVPFNVTDDIPADVVDRMTVSGLKGAVSDPLKAGFVSADIRAVANRKFLQQNPAAAKFLEVFTLPLADISAQTMRMENGEKAQKYIEQHAQEWIDAHQATWNAWLKAARDAAK
jgi:glycine betaine/proline transport system substrate-binding protein